MPAVVQALCCQEAVSFLSVGAIAAEGDYTIAGGDHECESGDHECEKFVSLL